MSSDTTFNPFEKKTLSKYTLRFKDKGMEQHYFNEYHKKKINNAYKVLLAFLVIGLVIAAISNMIIGFSH